MTLPIPVKDHLLIEPLYDPDKIGSIYMAPAAQNEAPSQGIVRAVGPSQTEIEVGYHTLMSTAQWVKKASYFDKDNLTRLFFYTDEEVIAFVTPDAEVFPRRNRIIVRPSWSKSGVVQQGSIFTVNRIFDVPQPPQSGTVIKVGADCSNVHVGETIVIPKWGGFELAVKDRVLYSLKEADIPARITDAVDINSTKLTRHRRASKGGSR